MTISKKQKCTDEKLIYVGPNLSNSKLLQYTVFIGGYPDWLEEEFESQSYGLELKRLFVPVEKLPEAQKEIMIKGKPLNKYYRKVMEYQQGGK